MKYLKSLILLSFFAYEVAYSAAPTSFSMVSPDGKLSAKIELKDKIYYSLAFGERQIIDPSPISMELSDGTIWGKDPVSKKNRSRNVNETSLHYSEKEKL